jgi:hypothetical protein
LRHPGDPKLRQVIRRNRDAIGILTLSGAGIKRVVDGEQCSPISKTCKSGSRSHCRSRDRILLIDANSSEPMVARLSAAAFARYRRPAAHGLKLSTS